MEPIILQYNGFESLCDYEEDIAWAISNSDLNGEFQGTLTITIEYKESDVHS